MANSVARHFQSITASGSKSKLEITVSCRHLKDRSEFSKCNPTCALSIYDRNTVLFYDIGRTETIVDSADPDFVYKFVLDYYFQESQKIRFEIYDVNRPGERLKKQIINAFKKITKKGYKNSGEICQKDMSACI
ncbi:hypothetical protein CHS0354_021737 [Potamilus streckersoni]|uniref:C2 domain-containing protein n=1 Tax=Potamilus streckersoni TaxID=2493646 RepID=A0AAE0TMP7_9BIVA|nr:hypothetical protein CHS0354_021737 [Potamilus streckersoni]